MNHFYTQFHKQFSKIVLIALTFTSAHFITACGNSTTATTPVTTPYATSGSCGTGYIFTSNLGCLQQTQVCSGTKAIINGICQDIASISLSNGNSIQNPNSQAQSCQAGGAWSFNYNQCLTQSATCSGQYGVYNGACVLLGTSTAASVNSNSNRTPFQGACTMPGTVSVQGQCLPQGQCQIGYGYGLLYQTQPYCFKSELAN